MLEFSSMVLPAPCPYLNSIDYQ